MSYEHWHDMVIRDTRLTTCRSWDNLMPSFTVSLLSVVPFNVLPDGRINLLYAFTWNTYMESIRNKSRIHNDL